MQVVRRAARGERGGVAKRWRHSVTTPGVWAKVRGDGVGGIP